MRTIDRYILRQIWPPMLLACAMISVVTIGGVLQEQINSLLTRFPLAPFTLGDLTKMVLFAIPTMSGYIVPVTFLMALLLAFGQMAQRGELIALKAAGISLKRVLLPVVAAGAAVTVICFLLQDIGQPWAYTQMRNLVFSEVPLRVTLDTLPTGTTNNYGGWRVHIGARDENGALRDIVVMQPQDDGRAATFYANSARLLYENGQPILEMRDGVFVPENAEQKAAFATLRKPVPVPDFTKRDRNREQMGIDELIDAEREYSAQFAATGSLPVMAELAKFRFELAQRTAFPFMCLAIALAAAPIGVRAQRSGRSYTFAVGAIVILLYFVVARIATPTSLVSLGEMFARAHAPNLLLAIIGLGMVWRVDRV